MDRVLTIAYKRTDDKKLLPLSFTLAFNSLAEKSLAFEVLNGNKRGERKVNFELKS